MNWLSPVEATGLKAEIAWLKRQPCLCCRSGDCLDGCRCNPARASVMYYTPDRLIEPATGSGAFLVTITTNVVGNPPYGTGADV